MTAISEWIKKNVRKWQGIPQRFEKNKNIQIVSFPRSGSGLLVWLLAKYFGRDVDLQQKLPQPWTKIVAGSFVWCEFYSHCKKTPCADRDTNFQKNHDFDLKLKRDESKKYIVQYREFLPATISHFKWNHQKKGMPLTKKHWDKFQKDQRKYYDRFINKWVSSKNKENICIVSYEDLLEKPEETLFRVIQYCGIEEEIDVGWISKVVAEHGIRLSPKSTELDFLE